MSHRRGGGGFSLIEASLALAFLGILLVVVVPVSAATLTRARVAAAAMDMAATFARLRAQAIAEHRRVGLRFTTGPGPVSFAVYADGDGDGVRSDDIASGRDPRLEPPRDLASHYDGIDFGVLATSIPEVPPQSGAILPGDDPIRFGSADIVTFTPWGTATGGSVFVSDGHDTVCAVVLYGKTGRLRTFRLDRSANRWVD
ncbi:MAG TPA: GspH/FimT family pseudopilin [Candidatus Polarisedimenticolia bacterium]|nr:GspH/FimT family pseudopilin [Candidatus Polarisedimenticolia bacterium]